MMQDESGASSAEQRAHEPHEVPEPPLFPRWVPVLIGVVLVTLASLAVFTGLRYRGGTLVNVVRPRPPQKRLSPAPPGEPQPGASLVFPGEAGDNAPVANAPVAGKARAVISGGAAGISSTVRIWARRGMMINAVPDDAVVTVNDLVIGQAKQFNSPDEIYDFPAPGSYTVRLSAPGYKDQQFIVTAADTAAQEIATIDARLKKQ